jgi:hypothetical protein
VVRARATEREKHFHISARVPSGLDERRLLAAAHADVAALFDEFEPLTGKARA